MIDVETVMDAITSARASAADGVEGAPVGTNTGTIGTVGPTPRAEQAAGSPPRLPAAHDGQAG